jgi:hypothetical protein
MSIRSLTVLLFAALALPANAAADDAKDDYRAAYAVQASALLAAQASRSLERLLPQMTSLAGRLESGDDDEKQLAPAVRGLLKLADKRGRLAQFDALIRMLISKNADKNRDLLNDALADGVELSADLKALRSAAEKCRPPRIDTPELRRDLAAARAALDLNDEEIDKELKAYVAKLPTKDRLASDLRELLDRVLVGQNGEGKSARGGGGEGKAGQGGKTSQHKPGEQKAGSDKELPYAESLFPLFQSGAKDHADLEALVEVLDACRLPLAKVAGQLKGKVQTACEDLASRLAAVHKRTHLRLSLHSQLAKLADVEEAVVEVVRRVKRVREELVKEQSKE